MWRQQSGGSEKSKVEIKAKEIEKMIANKAGCIQGGNLPIRLGTFLKNINFIVVLC